VAADPIQFPGVGFVERDGLGYVWSPAGQPKIRFHADYLTGASTSLAAEVTITYDDNHLHMATVNLSSTRERNSVIDFLNTGASGAMNVNWSPMVEQFCVAILKREREGSPTKYPEPTETRLPTVYSVDKLVIQNATNSIYAPGGSGKGYLIVGISCALMSQRGVGDLTTLPGKPFYLDWEDNWETFNDRLNAVARGMNTPLPRVPWRKMRGLLSSRINEIARIVEDEGCDTIIIDSFSAAGGTVDGKTSWDAIAHRFFDATDLLEGKTWIIIDHVNSEGAMQGGMSGKAFGSIQKHNRVRNAWEMRSTQQPGSLVSHMVFKDGKWNHTGQRESFGMRLEFSKTDVKFFSEAPVEPQAAEEGLREKVRAHILEHGRKSQPDLARELGVDEGAIRNMINRDSKERAENRLFAKDSGYRGVVRVIGMDSQERDSYEEPESLPFR